MVASLLALLALALSPTIGRAETSSEKVYHLGPESIESEPEAKGRPDPPANHRPAPHADPQNPAPSATGEDGEETPPGPSGEPRLKRHHQGERHQGHAAPPGKRGGHPPADGGGSEGATRTVAHTQAHPTPTATGASKSMGGGSSPVLLILIAMAILAVGSVGIALYRERKQAGNAEGHPGS
jgi:hypothetical protein